MSIRIAGKLIVTFMGLATLNMTYGFSTCPSNDAVKSNLQELERSGKAMFSLSDNPVESNIPLYLVGEKIANNNFNNKLLGTPQSLKQFISINQKDPNIQGGAQNLSVPRLRNVVNQPPVCAYNLSVGTQNAVIALSDRSAIPSRPVPTPKTGG